MAEFTKIETQEQLDSIIGERLERERKKNSEMTAGFQSEIDSLKSKNAELEEQAKATAEKYSGIDERIAEYEKEIARYKTDLVKTEVARKVGLPFEMRDRLRGETEEEITKDAEALVKLMPKTPSPAKRTEPKGGSKEDEKASAWKDMLKNNQ